MTEEERAAQFRAECAARLQARRDQLAALTGDTTARSALEDHWAAARDWLRERTQPPVPLPEPVENPLRSRLRNLFHA